MCCSLFDYITPWYKLYFLVFYTGIALLCGSNKPITQSHNQGAVSQRILNKNHRKSISQSLKFITELKSLDIQKNINRFTYGRRCAISNLF